MRRCGTQRPWAPGGRRAPSTLRHRVTSAGDRGGNTRPANHSERTSNANPYGNTYNPSILGVARATPIGPRYGQSMHQPPVVKRGSGNRLPLIDLLARRNPPVDDPVAALDEFRVVVDGVIVTNPRSRVRADAAVVVKARREPQGVRKLGSALDRLDVVSDGRLGLDIGACTGGFTLALLARGCRRVVAVDVGYGQLLGSLQQDPRVVNLERTNVADLSAELLSGPTMLGGLPEVIVTDVTKIPLRQVGLQLAERSVPAPGADFVGLVKPMFELATGELPTTPARLHQAVDLAATGLAESGWIVLATIESAVRGRGGAVEFFIHARWPSEAATSEAATS